MKNLGSSNLNYKLARVNLITNQNCLQLIFIQYVRINIRDETKYILKLKIK